MKAPDKIYFEIDEKGKVHTYFGLQSENATEYIRKDALLEWAKEHKLVIETHGDERDAYLRGEYSALNSLIDKLNSM